MTDPSKVENPDINDKSDALVHEAEEAIHGVQLSLLSDPALKAEMPSFFSKECRKLLGACAAGYFATTLYGYDAGIFRLQERFSPLGVMSGINVMTTYQHYFGVAAIGGATGLIFSLFYAGAFVAIAMGFFIADRYGRKMPIIVGAIVSLCGAIISATSMSSAIPLYLVYLTR